MSNTSSNFEMAGVLLGKEVRKRKTPQEKSQLFKLPCLVKKIM
ncbi:hypothetical protein G918_04742 [Escherichia coli UMEA 3150-1]|nr:hypothetical protein G918_04742 [Escherichia coli UMEA 3150-1]